MEEGRRGQGRGRFPREQGDLYKGTTVSINLSSTE
jgi:hypothetical protein